MKISYELFKEAIEFIDKREQQYEQLSVFAEAMNADFCLTSDIGYCTLVRKLLVEATNDKYDYISYFMWELDFGRNWKPGTVTDSKGTDIPLGTIEDLWKLLETTLDENEADNG